MLRRIQKTRSPVYVRARLVITGRARPPGLFARLAAPPPAPQSLPDGQGKPWVGGFYGGVAWSGGRGGGRTHAHGKNLARAVGGAHSLTTTLSPPPQFFGAWAASTTTPLSELVPHLLTSIKPAYVGDHAVAM